MKKLLTLALGFIVFSTANAGIEWQYPKFASPGEVVTISLVTTSNTYVNALSIGILSDNDAGGFVIPGQISQGLSSNSDNGYRGDEIIMMCPWLDMELSCGDLCCAFGEAENSSTTGTLYTFNYVINSDFQGSLIHFTLEDLQIPEVPIIYSRVYILNSGYIVPTNFDIYVPEPGTLLLSLSGLLLLRKQLDYKRC